MTRFVFFLCGCLWVASATAAEVQIFSQPPAADSDAALREAELALVKRTMATLPKPAVAPARKSAKPEAPARAVPANPRRSLGEFHYEDSSGRMMAAPIVDRYRKDRIVAPLGKRDPRVSPLLQRAASIAQERAHAHSKSRCWRYVKNALLAAGVINSYPKTAYAKQAGEELVRDFGFKKLPIRDPYKAPVGAVLVYGSRRAAGHVEIRTKTGFVSDFQNKKPSPRPLIGIYAKA